MRVRGARCAVRGVLALALAGCRPAGPGEAPRTLGIGRPATAQEIAAWDIDVRPDGLGLPDGRGTAREGAPIYAKKCASCHGATGTEGPAWRLVGREPRQGFPFGRDPDAIMTVGNYWPYSTTVYDYINRAMPNNAPGSLRPSEVYALTAFLLWKNEIIADTAVMDRRTLPLVQMPAHDRFVVDNRKGGSEVR